MGLLTDKEIEVELAGGRLLKDAAKYDRNLIQPASLDMSIGSIYVPGTDADRPGGVNSEKTQHSLAEGGTAVVETREEIKLDHNQVGIVFLPSSISSKGILTTNPGLVDPGYEGKLHLTIINMSKDPYPIYFMQRILRVVIFNLDSSAGKSVPGNGSRVTPELLARLSDDFLSVDKRVAAEIKRQEVRERRLQITIPLSLGILALAGTLITQFVTNASAERKFSERVTKIEQNIADIKDNSKAEAELSGFDVRIKNIESKMGKKN